jgi:transcriptional regulator with XRE-family HTH domain
MDIGERLKKAREARGLSKSQVARFAGVSPATLTRWEKGARNPRPEHLKRVLAVLRITYEDLWKDHDEDYIREKIAKANTSAEDVRVVLTANPDLTPSEIEVIMRIVESKERELREKRKKG